MWGILLLEISGYVLIVLRYEYHLIFISLLYGIYIINHNQSLYCSPRSNWLCSSTTQDKNTKHTTYKKISNTYKSRKNCFVLFFQTYKVFIVPDVRMVKKTIVVALAMLLLASVATFVGVFFGVGRRKPPSEKVYLRAAVAADAGPCSEIGRWELAHWIYPLWQTHCCFPQVKLKIL